MSKHRRVRTFVRTAAKSVEKKLVDNAKMLKDDPYLILPDYDDGYSNKIFNKIKKRLSKIEKFKEDTKKLEKLSNKKGFEGAVAGTLFLAHSEKAPYLAVAKFQTGDITYAQRGKAEREKLIAVQHFDDPILRLLGFKDIAIKKGLHLYSWDEGFVSTGLEANPPKEFIEFLSRKSDLINKNNVLICSDLSPESVKIGEVSKRNYLKINWNSGRTIFAFCEDCAKNRKNTIFDLTKYLIEPKISQDFSIEVIGQVIKQKEKSIIQTQSLNEYLSGTISDIEFIKKNMKHREESIKSSGEKILILDGVSYGTDIDRFIEAIKPNKYEKKGLELILEEIKEPVIFNNITSSKLLEIYWKNYGLNAIKSIVNDEELAKKFFLLDDTPSNILEHLFSYLERQQILSQLPRYRSLPQLANFIDGLVKTYKTFGEKEALAEIKKRPDDPKGKSIAYAFLLAIEKGKDKKWQYSEVEIEYGEFLKDYVKKLLNSDPRDYHKMFQELLIASGSSEDISKNLI